MNLATSLVGALAAGFVSLSFLSLQAATLIGPIPYFSRTNSPFHAEITNGTMFIETFESGVLSVPGITRTRGKVAGPAVDTHSVDADDGQIDGKGTNGHSFRTYIPYPPRAAHTFLFDTNILGNYPTKVGIVVTYSAGAIFNCYGADALGEGFGFGALEAIGIDGQFFGMISSNGIAWIRLQGYSHTLEVDHLQYGDFDAGAGLVLGIEVANNNMDVCWYGRWNVTYQLQSNTNLPSGPWSDLGASIQGSGSRSCVTVSATGDAQRFYRVVALRE